MGFNKQVILTFSLFSDILRTRAAQYNFFQHQHCMNNCHGAGCANVKCGKLTQTQVSYFPRLIHKKTFVKCNIIQSNLFCDTWVFFCYLWMTCRLFLHSEPRYSLINFTKQTRACFGCFIYIKKERIALPYIVA